MRSHRVAAAAVLAGLVALLAAAPLGRAQTTAPSDADMRAHIAYMRAHLAEQARLLDLAEAELDDRAAAEPDPAPTVEPSPSPTPTTTAPPASGSGLPWHSGAFTRHSDTERRAMESYRGRPLDLVDVHPTRDTWSSLLNPWWINAYADFPGRLSVAMPLWPRDSTLVATAGHADEWAAFGRLLRERGHGDAYVRLGWEFNLPGQYWHATDPTADAWVTAFRRAVTAIRSEAPDVKIVWNPNEGRSQTMGDDRRVWPGAGYVDVVGVDGYDWYQPVRDAASWEAERTETGGWQYWLDFARDKGVKFAVPEWGVYSASSASGGDNPYYIRALLGWLAANRASVAYEAYFNETAAYCGCHVVPDTRNPRAAAAYRDTLAAIAEGRL